MQKIRMSVYRLGQADPSKLRRAPFWFGPVTRRVPVCKAWAHVVEQKVAVGPDQLIALRRMGIGSSGEFWHVTGDAVGLVKEGLSARTSASSISRRAGTAWFAE